ncbi:PAS domain S-box protein, partial [Candidatus Bathyarchaeota archaeon]|nr:PAS domain S-box protein [Candidatus Bathyarchaeota archaeon]
MQVSQHRNKETADLASTLDASEQELRSLVDYAAVAIAFVDLRGRLTHVNSSFADLLGYQADELLGLQFKDFLHPADRGIIVRLFLKVGLLRRQPRMMEFRALHKDGRTLHLTSKPTRTIQNGKTIGFQAILTDITEHHRMERALKESEERYRSFFENSPDALLLTAPDGRILSANPEACHIFGRTEEEICQVGRNGVVDLTDPRLPVFLRERTRTGRAEGDLTLRRKDGTKFSAEVTSAVFKDENGFEKTS